MGRTLDPFSWHPMWQQQRCRLSKVDLFSNRWEELPKQMWLYNSFKWGRRVDWFNGASIPPAKSSSNVQSAWIRKITSFGQDNSCRTPNLHRISWSFINSPPKTFKIDVTYSDWKSRRVIFVSYNKRKQIINRVLSPFNNIYKYTFGHFFRTVSSSSGDINSSDIIAWKEASCNRGHKKFNSKQHFFVERVDTIDTRRGERACKFVK